MPNQTPAPRYSRPIPASKLPPLDTFLPRHRPLRDQAVHAARVIIARERDDKMCRIGAAFGILAALALVALLAGCSPGQTFGDDRTPAQRSFDECVARFGQNPADCAAGVREVYAPAKAR